MDVFLEEEDARAAAFSSSEVDESSSSSCLGVSFSGCAVSSILELLRVSLRGLVLVSAFGPSVLRLFLSAIKQNDLGSRDIIPEVVS